MVTCKEIDDYLKYAEEHPKWINKKEKITDRKHREADIEAKRCFF